MKSTHSRGRMRLPLRPAWMPLAFAISDALVIVTCALFLGLAVFNLGRFWGAWS